MARKTFTTTIDEEIQAKFKEACTANGEKMNDVLEAFMKGYIQGDFIVERELKVTQRKQ